MAITTVDTEKITGRKKIIIAIIVFAGLVGVTIAAAWGLRTFRKPGAGASSENKPRNVRLSEITPQRATITWVTEKPAYGFISYGETMSLGRTSQEAQKTTTHSITIANLKPGTTYYYKIGVGEAIFDDAGIPYSFTTPAQSEHQPETTGNPQSEGQSGGLTLEGFKAALGTNNPQYDLDKDGKVGASDISLFLQNQKEATSSASPQ